MKTIFIFFLVMLLTSTCSSSQSISTPFPTKALTPTPTSAMNILSTPTDIQLPYNLVQESSEYCESPYAVLSMSDAESLSEDEIARKLVEIWLERYKNPKAHPYCRIDEENWLHTGHFISIAKGHDEYTMFFVSP